MNRVRRKLNFRSKNVGVRERERETEKYFTMHKFKMDITQEIKSEFLFFERASEKGKKIRGISHLTLNGGNSIE